MKNKKQTHYDRVLKHLQEHGAITSWESIELFGNTRLSATIFDLRQDGFNIKSETITTKNRYGDPTHYTKYTLEEK